MKKITKILLATDFSEDSYNAYKYALELINEMKVELLVLHVVPSIIEPSGLTFVEKLSKKSSISDAVIEMRSFIQRGISEMNYTETNFYEKIQTDIEVGDPVKTIGEIVERNQINLIITGRRGQSNNIFKSLGSISLSLLNDLKTDIFIIPNKANYKTINKVLFASADYSNDSYYIEKTKEIFQKKDIEFEHVHVAPSKTTKDIEEQMAQTEFYSNNAVKYTLLTRDDTSTNTIVEALITFSKDKALDALVLLERKKGIFQKLFTKNTAKEVIKLSENPILVLKNN